MTPDDPRITRWINPVIREMRAYHVPEAKGLIKLDAMENPYAWPAELQQTWLDALKHAELNRYPDPQADRLKQSITQIMPVPHDHSIILGNGSDEIIQMIMLAVTGPGRVILAPGPGFVMYRIIARTLGLEYVEVPLDDDFSLDTDAMISAIKVHQPAVIFLASPNNPTGNSFDKESVQRIIQAAPGLVVIDEAYFIFSATGFMDQLGNFDNLLVMRTLSKLGLAGLRVGFLAGPGAWLQELDKIRLPYNVNILSQVSADFFLGHYPVLQKQAAQIIEDREEMYRKLQAMEGITVFSSDANFLMFRLRDHSADQVFHALKEKGVLIKNLHGTHPVLNACLRVTVGKPDENQAFLQSLREVLMG